MPKFTYEEVYKFFEDNGCKLTKFCIDCDAEIFKTSFRCKPCNDKFRFLQNKQGRPSYEQLLKDKNELKLYVADSIIQPNHRLVICLNFVICLITTYTKSICTPNRDSIFYNCSWKKYSSYRISFITMKFSIFIPNFLIYD